MGDRNSDHQLCRSLKKRQHTVHEVSVSTVDFDEIVSNLLTPLDGFQPFRLEVLEVLCSSGNWLGVESLVE